MRRVRLRAVPCLGFTLIELLVAITLMALVSVILFGGLRFGVRAWEGGGARVEQSHRVEVVQNLLRRQISQARLLPRATDADAVMSFAGDVDSLTFIAPLPAHRGIAGSYLFHLRTVESAGRSDLALTWSLYRPELLTAGASASEDGTILLQDIAGIELSYFGALSPGQAPQWWGSWDVTNGGPQLVRVRVAFQPGDRRRWPDLIIRVRGTPD